MSSPMLTQQEARRLIGEIFVYHMPFNQALGLELDRLEADYAELGFANKTMLVGNAAQQILRCRASRASAKRSCVSACRAWAPLICASTTCARAAASALSPPAACCAPGIKSR